MYEYEKYLTAMVPETITVSQMQRILADSENKRLLLFKYFYKVEMAQRKRSVEKEVRAEKEAEKLSTEKTLGVLYDEQTNAPIYGLWRHSLFINLTSSFLVKKFDAKLYESTLFGQPLVFDFSFESLMNDKCLNALCKQIAFAIGGNRTYDSPFSLWFCNLQKESKTDNQLVKAVGNLYPKSGLNTSFINVHSGSYLDFFPKEKLVYLTPDSNEELHVFDVDKVYIIGSYVDLLSGVEKRATIQTAKRLGLKTAKLPIDHYAYMKGCKAFTLDQMVNILNTIKHTNSWHEAFKHIPQRKVKTPEEVAELERRRLSKMKFIRKTLHTDSIIKEALKE
ncbi:tRNA methyltransferase-like protein [Leptotrombidium deliense]|uniref:RNA (guanine-9-)-methyltransferase domain-containing protein 1 n=1 Tax=Leptotrombidium deliense TaxID=299467 RepID=A0A443STT7_9ACAR|nr:tRNA methyltransferase-like protein [Leptotrombidium deliense]